MRLMSFLSAIFALVLALAPAAASEGPPEARFVGSSACGSCHTVEHGEWLQSQHKAAMQEPSEATMLGRFDGQSFRQGVTESVFFRKDGRFFIRTEGSDGRAAEFPVKYAFGLFPLQQYLVEGPGGRLQAFGVAWDSRPAGQGGQRWFALIPNLKAGDPLHWTGIDQNWNYQCAWCHSTNVRKNYDQASGAFSTTFSEISVGCEACHGPASNHLDWAQKRDDATPHRGFAIGLDQRKGVSWDASATGTAVRSGPAGTDREALLCAGCHSRRQQFSDDPVAAARFYDAFRPVTLEAGLYYVDGQQRDEVYDFGSFLQSKMHSAGVTCLDCHNPHSGKLRLAGNEVCGQCHAAGVFDQASHHRHAPGSTGAQCANCHMPTTTYMEVDARHDHSMRIPRPDRTISLATPNACNNCHAGKTAAWAVEAVRSWGAGTKTGAQTFAEALHLADSEAPGAGTGLVRLAADGKQPAIVRATALQRLAQGPTPGAVELASSAVSDRNPMVRSAAVAVLAGSDPATKSRVLPPALSDETRLVRMDAARALAGAAEASLSASDRLAFEKALSEYVDGQLFNAERPEAQANLGGLNLARGNAAAAREAYSRALAIDKTFAPAAISLAEIARAGGDEAAAEATLRKSLLDNPGSAALSHALGLSLIRQKRLAEALENLAQAAKLAPDDARFAYVYGVALHDTGAQDKARDVLDQALARHPFNRDILMALASYDLEAGLYAAALPHAERLAELEPDDRSAQNMVAAIRAMVERLGR